jgi:ubiquitin carboxyl-terminal hydrolase 5/13
MLKLADGLLSGRYSHIAKPPPDFDSTQDPPKFQEGIRPSQFKALIGKGHEEFSTMRQQDSEEFLQHLFTRLRQEAKRLGRGEEAEATNVVRFGMEQRLECGSCRKVGYRVDEVDLASLPVEVVEKGVNEEGKKLYQGVGLEECIEGLCAVEELGDYACSSCGNKGRAEK